MRFDYKRRSVSGLVHPAAVPPPAQVAPRILALPNRLPQSCHGPIPMPAALGDPIPHPDAFGSLRDWCVRGPARCTCAWQVSSQTYNLQCDIGDHLLDTVPEIVDCHNNCDCGEPDPAARIQALAAAALFLARVRAGVGP